MRVSPLTILAAALAAAGILASAASAAAPPSVTAAVKYADGSKLDLPVWTDIRVSVARNGVPIAVDQPLPAAAAASYFSPPVLRALDLSGDGEPEILVDVSAAGYDALHRTALLHYDGHGYASQVIDWGADTRTAVAAYAVDLARTGQLAAARAAIRRAADRRELHGSAGAFTRTLDRRLVRWGYGAGSTLGSL